jgi:hypothetical protein
MPSPVMASIVFVAFLALQGSPPIGAMSVAASGLFEGT